MATSSFTDGNVDFALATVDQDAPANLSWTVNWSHHKDSPSCGAPATTGSTTYLGNSPTVGGSVAVGNGQSTKPTSVSATGYTLAYWSSSATSTTALTAAQLCKPGPGSATLYAHFDSATQPTTLTVGNASGTYGGTATLSATLTSGTSGIGGKTVSFKLNGTSVGTATTNSSGVASLANASLAGISAGSFPTGVEASFAAEPGFTGSTATGLLTVAKANQSITFAAPSGVTFGDADSDVGATATSGLTVGYTTSTPATCTIVAGKLHVVGGGTCTITAAQAGNGNYNAAPSVERSIVIAKAASTVNVVWADATFDGGSHPATGSVDGVGSPAANLGSPSFTYYAGSDTTGTALAGAPTNAGTYTVLASFGGDGNYNGDTAEKTIVIAKAASTVNVVWADATFDGGSHPATGSVDGVGSPAANLGSPSFTYYAGSDTTGTALAGAPTNAGTYTVLASFGGDGNYNGHTAEKTIVIAKAASTVNVVWADATFDGGSHPATGSVDGVGSPAANLGSPSFTYYAGSDTTGTALAGAPTNAGIKHGAGVLRRRRQLQR